MSQVKVTTLMNADGSKQALSNDVIDGTAKTKLFSPFSLAMLAGVDAATLRGSLVAAASGVNGDITSLTGLTTPLSTAQGGTGKNTVVLEVGKGYIDGLQMIFNSARSITVTAGRCMSPAGAYYVAPADITKVGITLVASGFTHVYMYDNGGVADLEFSATIPVRYSGTAFQKTGDPTRRYIGSLLANAGSNMYAWRHNPVGNQIDYLEGTPTAVPFLLTNAWGGTTASIQPTTAAVPIYTATHVHLGVQVNGLCYFADPEQLATPGAGNFGCVVGSLESTVYSTLNDVWINCCRTVGGNLGAHKIWVQNVSGALVSTWVHGYRYER